MARQRNTSVVGSLEDLAQAPVNPEAQPTAQPGVFTAKAGKRLEKGAASAALAEAIKPHKEAYRKFWRASDLADRIFHATGAPEGDRKGYDALTWGQVVSLLPSCGAGACEAMATALDAFTIVAGPLADEARQAADGLRKTPPDVTGAIALFRKW